MQSNAPGTLILSYDALGLPGLIFGIFTAVCNTISAPMPLMLRVIKTASQLLHVTSNRTNAIQLQARDSFS
jgi:hypothetical protein